MLLWVDEGVVEESGWAVQVGGDRDGCVRSAVVVVVFGAGDEDPFDGPIGGVADVERASACGVETFGTVTFGKTEDALGGTQAVEGVDRQQFGDEFGAGLADLGRASPTPRRGAHHE